MWNASDLNKHVLCLAPAEVEGAGVLWGPEPDPGAEPEAAAAPASWNQMMNYNKLEQCGQLESCMKLLIFLAPVDKHLNMNVWSTDVTLQTLTQYLTVCIDLYYLCWTCRVRHCGFLSSAQLQQAFGAVSVEQVLCAAGWRLRTSGVGDGGRRQAVLYILVHVHSGGPGLPVEKKEKKKTQGGNQLGVELSSSFFKSLKRLLLASGRRLRSSQS